MKIARKILIVAAVLCGLILVLALLFFLTMSPRIQPIGGLDLSRAQDGEYIGECDNRVVKVTVAVSVENHRITEINILQHDNGLGEKAEEITDKVLEAQSLDVDAVSGATFSSNTILKAIENALEGEGEKNESDSYLQIRIRRG